MKRLIATAWRSATLMTWASLTVRIGGLALLLPIVISHMTTAEVLVWQLLSTITMLINLTDFGFSPTFARIIAFARGGGSVAELARAGASGERIVQANGSVLSIPAVVAAQRVVYRVLIAGGMVVALVGGAAALNKPISHLPVPADGWAAGLLSALAGLLVLANGANVSILTGFDRIATARRLDAVLGALQLGSTCVVALLDGGLVPIVGCYAAWTIPLYAANRYNVRRLDIGSIDSRRSDPELLAAVWRSAWRSGVGILMSTGIIQASGLAYAQIASPADAAAYLLLLRAMTAVSQIAQAPFYSKLPTMAALRGKGEIAELAKVAIRGMALANWTFVAGALGLVATGPILLNLIGSSVHLPAYVISAVLVLAFFVERYSAMHIQIYSLTHHIVWHVMNGVTGVLMIVYASGMYPFIGRIALPLAMLFGYLTFFAWRGSALSLRSLDYKRRAFEVRTTIWPASVLLATLFGLYWLQR
mgnify:CR=1 FL=1